MAGSAQGLKGTIKQLIRAQLWRGALKRYRKDAPYVIAVGGSIGKTSTKEAIAQAIEIMGGTVVKTHANMATDFGVALSLLGCTDSPAGLVQWIKTLFKTLRPPQTVVKPSEVSQPIYYVLEYSTDSPGDTAFLTNKIAPTVAVLTSITPVHMEIYKTMEVLCEETVALVDALPLDGIIIANADDPLQRAALTPERCAGHPLLWYGMDGKVKVGSAELVTAAVKTLETNGMVIDVSSTVGSLFQTKLQTNLFAPYQLYPVMAAALLMLKHGAWGEPLAQFLLKYIPPAGRGRIIAGKHGMTLIDDTANASFEPLEAGLMMMTQVAQADSTKKRRRVAIIGSMNEMGDMADEVHTKAGMAAARYSDYLVAVGPRAKNMVQGALAGGMAKSATISFSTAEKMLTNLEQLVRRGDVVYAKASQNGMFFERIIQALMADPNQAPDLLVRQGEFWQKLK